MPTERLIRPFQTPQNTPAIDVPFGAPARQAGPVIVRIIASGPPRTFSSSASTTTNVYVKKYPKETEDA